MTAGCSLMYVVAQIYGIGLITSRLTGLGFEMGVFVGLGGVLVCSFVGGMRAITWTQVAQYMILMIAFLVPVLWLSIKQTGQPLPQLALAQQLQKVSERERELLADPRERAVMAAFRAEADVYTQQLQDVERSLNDQRRRHCAAGADGASPKRFIGRRTARRAARTTGSTQRRQCRARSLDAGARCRPRTSAAIGRHACRRHSCSRSGDGAEASAGQSPQRSRLDFVALVFCLMAGTAGMPHILARFYTTPSVVGGAALGDVGAVVHRAAVRVCAGAGGAREVRGADIAWCGTPF